MAQSGPSWHSQAAIWHTELQDDRLYNRMHITFQMVRNRDSINSYPARLLGAECLIYVHAEEAKHLENGLCPSECGRFGTVEMAIWHTQICLISESLAQSL
jgi:hypothetical protein